MGSIYKYVFHRKDNTELDKKVIDEQEKTIYFRDGIRRIDHILVYNKVKANERRTTFLMHLKENELELEETISLINPAIIFVKVHAPKEVLLKFSEYFDIPIKYQQTTYLPPSVPHFKFRRSVLNDQDYTGPIFQRAEQLLSGNQPNMFTSYERNLIVYNILKRIQYDSGTFNIGIEHLLTSHVFLAAYPLHDGTAKWNNDPNAPLNTRQLLAKYWVNYKILLQAQPLHLLENYYGDQIALYFALMEYYNSMLIFPILVGLVVMSYGIYLLFTFDDEKFLSITDSIRLCPACQTCNPKHLNSTLLYYKMSTAIDNSFSVFYAAFMSIWSAVFLIFWKRKQSVIDLQWNIQNSEYEEVDIRPEFRRFAKDERISELGIPEQYIPWWSKAWRMTFSYSAFLFMISLVLVTLFGLIIFELILVRYVHGKSAPIVTALLTAMVIDLLRRIYSRIIVWLTELEVPKTQTDFDSSYIFKLFIFSFINNYGSLFYLAFFKARFYTHPNDPRIYKSERYDLITDLCFPPNCMAEVVILINMLLLYVPIATHTLNFISRKFKIWQSRRREKIKHIPHSQLPRWERDFELNELDDLSLFSQCDEMVAQFGYITLFAFACSYAGLIAVFFNTLKLKFEAQRLVTQSRRPQGTRTPSMGAWLIAMKLITYTAILTNACYIALTSEFVVKSYYQLLLTPDQHHNEYIYFKLSRYAVDKEHWPNLKITNCTYQGSRFPPESQLAYHHDFRYYLFSILQLLFIILFQNTVLIIRIILGYVITEQPQSVKDKYAEDVVILRKSNIIKSTFQIVDADQVI